ncbi:MAG: hypothetical protein JZU65_05210, partial [Chlorobium sp.]|nr:hypothetical protein [Chlorobium sp.]
MWKQTGNKPELLDDEPDFPAAAIHIWNWFQQLSWTRGGGFGPAPLTHNEIRSWYKNMGVKPRPTPWEIEQILRLDGIWFKVQGEKDKNKPGK